MPSDVRVQLINDMADIEYAPTCSLSPCYSCIFLLHKWLLKSNYSVTSTCMRLYAAIYEIAYNMANVIQTNKKEENRVCIG